MGIHIGIGLTGQQAGGPYAAAVTAPVISNFSTAGAPTSMSFDIDKNSTCYWLLDTNATRTAAQIIAGGGASDGNQAVTLPSETIAIDFSAVAYGDYFLHIVCDNGASSNVIDQAVELSAAPSAFVAGDWTSAQGSAASEIDLNIITLPASNNSAITSLEYSVDAGATWSALTGTGAGARTINQHSDGTTGALTAGASYDMMVRAVNAIGNGANSDTKATTSGVAASSDFVLNGAWFTDTANLAASTSVLEWEAYIKYPTATTSDSYLFVQVSGSALYTDNANRWRTKVEDSTNALLYSGTHGAAGGVGTKRVVNYKVDLTTDEITITVDGVVVANEPFTTASSGAFASNRKLGFASNGAGAFLLPADVEVEYFKVWTTTGGTRTLHKEISVAAQGSIAGINADPWITGTVTAA